MTTIPISAWRTHFVRSFPGFVFHEGLPVTDRQRYNLELHMCYRQRLDTVLHNERMKQLAADLVYALSPVR